MLRKLAHATCRVQGKIFALMAPLALLMAGAAPASALPPIESKSFEVSIERVSSSGRVVLLKSTGPLPGKRQLVLIRDSSGPIVALRTLQLYNEFRFAGEMVREYGRTDRIQTGLGASAVIKIRDLEPPPTDEQTDQSRGAPPDDLDLELDSKKGGPKPLNEEEDFELRSLVVDEVEDFEQEAHALSFRTAAVLLPEYTEGFILPLATGLRYSLTLMHPMFFSGRKLQDAFTVDFTALYTKLFNYTPSGGDAFSLAPLTLSGRYSLYFSPRFAVYGYGGLAQTLIVASSGEDPEYSEAATLLAYTQVALGVGLQFELGPQWWVQLDAGIDQLGAGLMLRF